MPLVAVAAIIFLAILTQTVSGFGFGLVSMALLPAVLEMRLATPFVSLIAVCAEALLLLRYRHALNLRAVLRLSLASLVGIPLGIVALDWVNNSLGLKLLGALILGYSLYALLNLKLPQIENPRWAYGFGFLSGILSGLYNSGGPPVVIYGTCRRWSPDEFRGNLQGFFILNSVIVIGGHALRQHFTADVLQYVAVSLPVLLLGVGIGSALAGWINPATFRRVVFVLLLVLGARLLLS
jgi:uncharacterized membrane protein YfcA